MKRDTIESMKYLAKRQEGECLSLKYVNNSTELKWRCGKGHVWSAVPKVIKRGSWCPECAGKISDLDDLMKFAEEHSITCLSKAYRSSTSLMGWRCNLCGFEWEKTFRNLKRRPWCKKCAEFDRKLILKIELLDYLVKLQTKLKRLPRTTDLKRFSLHPYAKYFGSFSGALKAAGIEPDRELNWTRALVIERLQQAYEESEGPLTLSRLPKFPYAPSITTIKKYLKVDSFSEALLEANLTPQHKKAWRNWEGLCRRVSKFLYGADLKAPYPVEDCIADLYLKSKDVIIDAMLSAYDQAHKQYQIPVFSKNAKRVELWCARPGKEIHLQNVKYVYREELARRLRRKSGDQLAREVKNFNWQEGELVKTEDLLRQMKDYLKECRTKNQLFSLREFSTKTNTYSPGTIKSKLSWGDLYKKIGLMSYERYNYIPTHREARRRIKSFAKKHRRPPFYSDLQGARCKSGCCPGPSSASINKALGTKKWDETLSRCGLLDQKEVGHIKYSTENIRKKIREIINASNSDKIAWTKEFRKRGLDLRRIEKKGETIEIMLSRYGVDPKKYVMYRKWSKSEILDLTERFIESHGRVPSSFDLSKRSRKLGLPPYSAVKGAFGSTENYLKCLSVDTGFRDFAKARKFVRRLSLANVAEWKKYCVSGAKPSDIPSSPNFVYKDSGWVGYPDWLGSKTLATSKRKFWPFPKARRYVRGLNLKNRAEWDLYYKSGKLPIEVPTAPWRTYNAKGWESLGDWLGTGTITNQLKKNKSKK